MTLDVTSPASPIEFPHSGPSMRRYACFSLLIALSMIAVQLWMAADLRASALFADDYDYLNKSAYYLRGDFNMTGYPFTNVWAGCLYPLVISPWMAFDDPWTRIRVVFAINAVLCGIAVFFASLAVGKLCSRPPWFAPLCLATLPSLLHFSFYVMTENLLLPLLAVAAWLVVDFEALLRSRRRIVFLLALCAALPLARPTGLAVCPALLALIALHLPRLGWRRSALLALAVIAAFVLPYLALIPRPTGQSAVLAARESRYVDHFAEWFRGFSRFIYIGRLSLYQLGYVFIAAGLWTLPVLAVAVLQFRASPADPLRTRRRNAFLFLTIASAALIAFCVLHLSIKCKFQESSTARIYGRYDDPAVLLLAIAGLAALYIVRPMTRIQRAIFSALPPVILAYFLASVIYGTAWSPVNQNGLSFMAWYKHGRPPIGSVALWLVLATLALQLRPPDRRHIAVLAVWFLHMNFSSLDFGWRYTRSRADRAATSVAAAGWINANTTGSARIGYDNRIEGKKAPKGVKHMFSVYRAMMFYTYPRELALVDKETDLAGCQYLFSLPKEQKMRELPVAWRNRYYVLYQVNDPPRLPPRTATPGTATPTTIAAPPLGAVPESVADQSRDR